MDFRAEEIVSTTGARLSFRLMVQGASHAEPRAVVQVNHGLAEHCARYERFARFLAGRGYATIAHDHRGHGHTTAPDAPLAQFGRAGMHGVIEDVSFMTSIARQRFPGRPVVTFGHSMGAIISLDYLATKPGETQAAAIWNTSFDTPFILLVLETLLKLERLFKGSDTPSRLAPAATFDAWNRRFAPNRTAFDWLSRDEAEVDRYVADPLCGFPASVGMWLSIIGSIRSSARRTQIERIPSDLPIHVCAGSRDPSSLDGAAMQRLADRLKACGLTDVTLRIFQDARHEGLNEINRDEIATAFADWLDARL